MMIYVLATVIAAAPPPATGQDACEAAARVRAEAVKLPVAKKAAAEREAKRWDVICRAPDAQWKPGPENRSTRLWD